MTRFNASNCGKQLHSLLSTDISRRSLLTYSLGSLLGIACSSRLSHGSELSSLTALPSTPLSTIAPLFCTAYINPTVPKQKGQESIVARYPIALVPQDVGIEFKQWRDRVKGLNPSILLLGYHNVNKTSVIPGPGHDKQRELENSWCTYPNGFIPTVLSSGANVRLFDMRKKEFQDNFLEACRAVLNSYPYDGLFLDNCTVFPICHPDEGVRAEMRQALQNTLTILRKEFSTQILVGNSSYHWSGLNGEMNEGRPNNMDELNPYGGHVAPRIQMYLSQLSHSHDIAFMKKEMARAYSHGAFFGASLRADFSQALWFDEFDDVIAEFKRASKKQL